MVWTKLSLSVPYSWSHQMSSDGQSVTSITFRFLRFNNRSLCALLIFASSHTLKKKRILVQVLLSTWCAIQAKQVFGSMRKSSTYPRRQLTVHWQPTMVKSHSNSDFYLPQSQNCLLGCAFFTLLFMLYARSHISLGSASSEMNMETTLMLSLSHIKSRSTASARLSAYADWLQTHRQTPQTGNGSYCSQPWERWLTDGRTDGQTDGRYQVHYLPCFAVDKNKFLWNIPSEIEIIYQLGWAVTFPIISIW